MASTLAWPVRIEGGDFAVVEVGTIEEARQNAEVLSQTRLRERVLVPEYGITDPVGEAGYDPAELVAAASRWCPGTTVTARPQPADRRDIDGLIEVSIP